MISKMARVMFNEAGAMAKLKEAGDGLKRPQNFFQRAGPV